MTSAGQTEPRPKQLTLGARRVAFQGSHIQVHDSQLRLNCSKSCWITQHAWQVFLQPLLLASQHICQTRSSFRQAQLCLIKRLVQGRPYKVAQPVTGQARIGIAVIFNVFQAVLRHIRRHHLCPVVQPRPRPAHTISPHLLGHGSQASHASTAKGLQQKSFCLIKAVVGQQHHLTACGVGHIGQRCIARSTRQGFNALPGLRRQMQVPCAQFNRQVLCRPLGTLRLGVGQPGISVCTQTMVHMQGNDLHAASCSCHAGRGIQQGCRVATATVGNGHAHDSSHRLIARWCR